MKDKIKLHTPTLEELSYRQDLLKQEDTMSHHKNREIASRYYYPKTGCIDFPREKWGSWYKDYTECKENLYYAFVENQNGDFIGEVSFYKSSDDSIYDMDVLIEAKHRQKGYGQKALHQVLLKAFGKFKVNEIFIETFNDNLAAIKLLEIAGFRPQRNLRDKTEFTLSKETFKEFEKINKKQS